MWELNENFRKNSEVGVKLKSQIKGLKKSYEHPWDQSVANIPKFLLPLSYTFGLRRILYANLSAAQSLCRESSVYSDMWGVGSKCCDGWLQQWKVGLCFPLDLPHPRGRLHPLLDTSAVCCDYKRRQLVYVDSHFIWRLEQMFLVHHCTQCLHSMVVLCIQLQL